MQHAGNQAHIHLQLLAKPVEVERRSATGVSPGTNVAAGVSVGDGDAGGPVYTGSPHIICCLIALYPGRPGRPGLNTPPICQNFEEYLISRVV